MNECKEIRLPATIDNISVVMSFVDEELVKRNCPESEKLKIDVAVDEIFANIASYAYAPEEGEATVKVEFTDEPLQIIISFIDTGKPYNPLLKEDPDTTLSADERAIGGLGIFIVKQSMDSVEYSYEEGCNVLKIKKIIGLDSKGGYDA
ncbi:MAG: ATP-binding protein [Lachnospiraceae bacterium]|nr:ATP-binding protein [Lachnospiraceae bacterium]